MVATYFPQLTAVDRMVGVIVRMTALTLVATTVAVQGLRLTTVQMLSLEVAAAETVGLNKAGKQFLWLTLTATLEN